MEANEAQGPPLNKDTVMDAVRKVIDPDLHYSIVDLGLIYDVRLDGKQVDVDMTLTSPGCPYGPMLIHQVNEVINDLGADPVKVDVVWEPPWSPERMTDEIKLEMGFDL